MKKVNKQIIAEVNAVVQGLVENCVNVVPKKTVKFFKEMILGIIGSGNVMLSEVGRFLGEPIKLIQTEKRLSYQLNNKRWDSQDMVSSYLKSIKKWIKEKSVISIDMGDITKEYARRSPYLGWVWDGSKKKASRGWWMVKAVCHHKRRQTLPLINHVFHTKTKRYRSHNVQVNHIIETLVNIIGNIGIWVFDRGFDDKKLFELLISLRIKFIVRIKGTRDLIPIHKPNFKRLKVTRIMRLIHKYESSMSFIPVIVPETNIRGTLVINTFGKEPCYLFTVIAVNNIKDACAVVDYYHRRWSVEDSDRVLKNVFNLENIRSRTYIAIKRLVHIATWALAVLFNISLLPKHFVIFLLSSVKSFALPKSILYYRLAKAVSLLLIKPFYCRNC